MPPERTGLRRRSVVIAGLTPWAAVPAWAQFRVEISGVGATQLPIAVVKFRDEEELEVRPGLSLRAQRPLLSENGSSLHELEGLLCQLTNGYVDCLRT